MSFPCTALNDERRLVHAIAGIFTALLTVFNFPSAFAADAPLTLAEAQRLAVAHSRQVPAQDYAASAAREMAVAAGQLPDPVLKLSVDNLPVDGPKRFSLTDDFMTMRSVGVMQQITRADKRRYRAERYEREAEKSLAMQQDAIAAAERGAALAWLDRYYAEAMAAVIDEQGAQAKLELQAAEGGYRAGNRNRSDVFMARSGMALFDDRASDAARRAHNARTMLARWIGPAAESPLAAKPDMAAVRLDPTMLDTQLAHHPQIAVLEKREQVAAAEAKLAQANQKADWSVEVMYGKRGPAYSNMLTVGVSIPLQWNHGNRQDRELAAKLALADEARAEREEALRVHVAETRVMFDEWQNKRERAARYAHELIPYANERTAAAVTAYRGNKLGLAEVLAARRNEIDVRLAALQLEAEAARLWAQLNFLFPVASEASGIVVPVREERK